MMIRSMTGGRMQTRRKFLGAAALGLFGGAVPLRLRAQGLETARIIVGFPPGGTTDVMARKVADKLRGAYARVVLVENRPGAGGQIGIVALKDSPADGSTMLLTPSSMLTIYPNTYRTLQYRLDDVAPVSLAMYTHHVLSVGPAVPDDVKTLKDFFAWAKGNPNKAAYGSPGAGSMPHLTGVLIAKASGTELRHVAYRGSAPGVQDLLGGQVASFLGPVGDVLAHSKAGKVRVLGSSGKERDTFLPAVPTMTEQGIKMGLREWYAFFMPARAGAEIVQRAAGALEQAIKQPDVVQFGKQFGLEVQASTPRALAELLKADAAEWSGLAKETGFSADS
jgi:tripartite-type tricarboxylate transporter receptor subunit TctC